MGIKDNPSDTVVTYYPLTGNRETWVVLPNDMTPAEMYLALTAPDGIIEHHFNPGTGPAWVICDHVAYQQVLADLFTCTQGRPGGWVVTP